MNSIRIFALAVFFSMFFANIALAEKLVLNVVDNVATASDWVKSNTSKSWSTLLNSANGDTDYGYDTSPVSNLRLDMDNVSTYGAIKNVTVRANCKLSTSSAGEGGDLKVNVFGIDYAGAAYNTWTTSYVNYTDTWTTNPNNSAAWTWSDLNQTHAHILSVKDGGSAASLQWRCTYVEMEIEYDGGAPQYSSLVISTKNMTEYESSKSYQFNATWTDSSGFSDVILEFNGVNYSSSSGQLSNQGSVYYRSFSNLAAGDYNYRWYAKDVYNTQNSTNTLVFSIQKIPSSIRLFLNNTENSRSYSSGALANLTVQALSKSANKFSNPSFESVRPGNSSLPESWFFGTLADTDADDYTWDLRYIDFASETFSGTRSIFYNVTYGNIYAQTVDSVWLKPLHISSPDTQKRYRLEFYTKSNMSFIHSDPIFILRAMDVFIISWSSASTEITRYVAQYNNTDIWRDDASLQNISVSWGDVENGWKKISVETTSNLPPTTAKLGVYFVQDDADKYNGYVLFDNATFYALESELSQTVNLDSNITGWVRRTGTGSLINTTTLSQLGTFNMTGFFSGNSNYSSSSRTFYTTVS